MNMKLIDFNRSTNDEHKSPVDPVETEDKGQWTRLEPINSSKLRIRSKEVPMIDAYVPDPSMSLSSFRFRTSSPVRDSSVVFDASNPLSPVHPQVCGQDTNVGATRFPEKPYVSNPYKAHERFERAIEMRKNTPTMGVNPPAVHVDNVSLTYGRKANQVRVLHNLCMRVEVGHIYALLGPSGCGKTSLLKIILNQTKPTSGTVRLFGCRTGKRKSGVPGNGVGYMPQELALCNDLNIAEMLYYFGKVGLMNERQINERIKQLQRELKLPDLHQIIDTLSGGQKRRVSLAIALMLNTRLLILDEPTVGVDPLLRQHIWHMLRDRIQYQCAVIITTHYVEEARGADRVGFLRYGRLLAQASPHDLLKRLECVRLEQVFYRLCLQEHSNLAPNAIQIDKPSDFEQDNKRNEQLELEHHLDHGRADRKVNADHNDANNNIDNESSRGHKSGRDGPADDAQQMFEDRLSKMNEINQRFIQHPTVVDKCPFEEPSGLNPINCWLFRQWAVICNCFKLNLRRPGTILAQYLLPILTTMLFCVCIGSTPNGIRLGVIIEEQCPVVEYQWQPKTHDYSMSGWNEANSHDPMDKFPAYVHEMINGWIVKHSNAFKRSKRDVNASVPLANVSNHAANVTTMSSTLTPTMTSTDATDAEEVDDHFEPEAPEILYNEFRNACFGHLFVKQIDTFVFDLKPMASASEAVRLTKQGHLWGFIKIPADFSRSTLARVFFADHTADIDLGNSQIKIHADLTNRVLLDTVQRSLRHTYTDFIRKALTLANQMVSGNDTSVVSTESSSSFSPSANDSHVNTPGTHGPANNVSSVNDTDHLSSLIRSRRSDVDHVDKEPTEENEIKEEESDGDLITLRFNLNATRSPIERQTSVFGSNVSISDFFGVRDFAAPGVLTVVAFSISFALTAFDLVIELEGHMLQRHLTAGVTNLQFVLGHCAARLPFTCTSGPLLLALCVYTFDLPCRGSFVASALLLTLQSVCGMCQALLVSALCPTSAVCAAVSNGFLVLLFIISGVFWSIETLPVVIRWISRIQPTSIPCESLRALLARGLPLSEPLIQLGFLITAAWSLVYFLAAVFIFYKRTSR